MIKDQKSKNKLIKKSSQRRFRNKNRRAFATHQESIDSFIIFFLNDMNQLIANNENEKNEMKKSNTIMLFLKTFIFFQKIKQAKDRFDIKINKENFMSLYYYDREFFEKDSQEVVFVNKKKFLKEIKTNF